MEQNSVGFPNSIYSHVGPYTPYFGFSYEGVGSVLAMWPPMSDPLINPMASLKLVLGIIQARIITDRKEPSDEDEDYFERKHNRRMPQIIPTGKSYHDRKERLSLIGDASRLLTNGWTVPINNYDGGPFGRGGNMLLGGGGSGPPRGGNNGSLGEVAIMNT